MRKNRMLYLVNGCLYQPVVVFIVVNHFDSHFSFVVVYLVCSEPPLMLSSYPMCQFIQSFVK